jgi:broad specificity phosphatase PhoE
MHTSLPEIYLARHGETAWTISHQHTGLTDIPLLSRGMTMATCSGRTWMLFERSSHLS